jgi:L-arabinose isomerase
MEEQSRQMFICFCQENVMAGKVKSLGGAEKVGVACLKFSNSQAGNFFTNGGVKLTTLIKYPGLGLSHLTLQSFDVAVMDFWKYLKIIFFLNLFLISEYQNDLKIFKK